MRTDFLYGKDGFFFPPDITAVEARPDRTVIITYANGEKRLFDSSQLQGPVFEVLKDDEVFLNPSISYDTITWANGAIDIDPQSLYESSTLL